MNFRGFATGALVGLMLVSGASNANAIRDSGVGNKGCPASQVGKLTVYMNEDGNTWAPGDWSSNSQWNSYKSYYRYVYDWQDSGVGGGYYRAYANGNYTSLTASCSSAS